MSATGPFPTILSERAALLEVVAGAAVETDGTVAVDEVGFDDE